MDYYLRLITAGVRPDIAADTIIYYQKHKTQKELEEYVQKLENMLEVSDR